MTRCSGKLYERFHWSVGIPLTNRTESVRRCVWLAADRIVWPTGRVANGSTWSPGERRKWTVNKTNMAASRHLFVAVFATFYTQSIEGASHGSSLQRIIGWSLPTQCYNVSTTKHLAIFTELLRSRWTSGRPTADLTCPRQERQERIIFAVGVWFHR